MTAPQFAERTLHAVIDGLQQAVWLIDARTLVVLRVNEAARQLVGCGDAEMVGRTVHELAHAPQDRIFWDQPLEDIAAGIHSCTTVWNARRGVYVPVERWVQAVGEGRRTGGRLARC